MVNADDQRLVKCARDSGKKFYQYGKSSTADYRFEEGGLNQEGQKQLIIYYQGQSLGEFTTVLLGEHNLYNLTAAIAVYHQLGFTLTKIQTTLAQFSGVKRRLELIKKSGSFFLYDDYAHHPTEIKASLSALKMHYPDHQLVVFFQPHTFSRTQALKTEFGSALNQADWAYLLPIFASSRERRVDFQISSEQIVKRARENGYSRLNYLSAAKIVQTVKSLRQRFAKIVFVTMGAGNVNEYGKEINTALEG
jgi:UDP-N-acetylmuramate--alanine ligase